MMKGRRTKHPDRSEFPNQEGIRKSSDSFAKYWMDTAIAINYTSWLAQLWPHFCDRGLAKDRDRFAAYQKPSEAWKWGEVKVRLKPVTEPLTVKINLEEQLAQSRRDLQRYHPDKATGNTAKFIEAKRKLEELKRKLAINN